MEVVIVYKVSFDALENRIGNAVRKKRLGIFEGNADLSAFGVAARFISDLEPHDHYLGWDGEVYPQYIIERENVSTLKEESTNEEEVTEDQHPGTVRDAIQVRER